MSCSRESFIFAGKLAYLLSITASGLVQRLIFNLTSSNIRTHRIVFRASVCDLFVKLDKFFKSN